MPVGSLLFFFEIRRVLVTVCPNLEIAHFAVYVLLCRVLLMYFIFGLIALNPKAALSPVLRRGEEKAMARGQPGGL